MRLIPPGLVLLVLFTVIASSAFYAALPYRRRAFIPILLMTALGFALGQGWDYIGLPALRFGQANIVPGVLFALGLQALVRFVPRPGALPQEPAGSNPPTDN